MASDPIEVKGEKPPPFWGLLSLAIPVGSVMLCLIIVANGSKGVGGDMVGLGFLIYGFVGVGIASVFGLVAGWIAVKKDEGMIGLAIAGSLLNMAIALLGSFMLLLTRN